MSDANLRTSEPNVKKIVYYKHVHYDTSLQYYVYTNVSRTLNTSRVIARPATRPDVVAELSTISREF